MKKVYVVEEGQYSDRQVYAVFSSEKEAEKIIDRFDAGGVTEFILNDHALKSNMDIWRIRMDKQGNTTSARIENEWCNYENATAKEHWFDANDSLCADVFAKDKEHAVKIVNEKRAQLIAKNKFGWN